MSNVVKVINLGLVEYLTAKNLQDKLVQLLIHKTADNTLILLEHPPTITIGRNGNRNNILVSEEILLENGIELYEVDRGGDVTLHCPGQLVGYPIIDLSQNGKDVHKYIRNLEKVIIKLLKDYGIVAKRIENYTGVWVRDKKIASIGIGVKHWITYHGFALNVNPDLSYFSLINPCGLKDKKMTSLCEILGQEIDKYELRRQLVKNFCQIFNLEMQDGFPPWIRKNISYDQQFMRTESIIEDSKLHTVCQSAECPNIAECFSQGRVTFMILGDVCTRDCKFCAVSNGVPLLVDPEEPKRVAQVVEKLRLKHVVITSVTRDDLADGGAQQFVKTINEIRNLNHGTIIEVLIPDFQGSVEAITSIIEAKPDIIAHNLETVPRLYPEVRPQASYIRSLNLLEAIKMICNNLHPSLLTKSGLMLGLGETSDEVLEVMQDLRNVQCDILTLGQYLQPTKKHLPVKEFVLPEEFERYKEIGKSMGFKYVISGPFVRSSYDSIDRQ